MSRAKKDKIKTEAKYYGMIRIYGNIVRIKLLGDVCLILRFNLFLCSVILMLEKVILDLREWLEKC